MIRELAAGIALAGAAVALAALVVLHLVPTGLSPLHNPVSQYGITRYRAGYRVLTLALGVAGLAAAAVVVTGYPPRGRAVIVALLVVFGVCRLVISWWPMDPPGAARSGRGTAHIVLAIGAFVAVTIAANRMQDAVAQAIPPAPAYRAALQAAFWLCVIGLAGQVLTRRAGTSHRYFGAAERFVYAGILVLLIATGLALI